MQFKRLKDRNKLGVPVNVVSRGENSKQIERCHRLVEERGKFYCAMTPFDTLPRMMVVHLMITVMFYVNAFVWMNGVSNFLSSLTILEVTCLDYHLHFRVMHGEFLQTCEGTRNDMNLRTIDALALGPNTHFQGGIRCFSLVTIKVFQCQLQDVEICKMPVIAISRINCMCK